MASTTSNAPMTQGAQSPATGANAPRSLLSFFDPSGRPVTLIEFFTSDMASRGGHLSVSSKDDVAADRATLGLVSEIASAFVQGSTGFANPALVATALDGLDWNDVRRLTQSGHS